MNLKAIPENISKAEADKGKKKTIIVIQII
jgi:hypothetical protein